MMSEDRIKVLTTKLGFDVHDRGITVVNMGLRDAGMEVLYIGPQFPKGIAETTVQEDPDVIGVSILSSTYMDYLCELTRLMKEKSLDGKLLIVGGVVLPDDVPKIKEMGVGEFFPPGSPMGAIINYISDNVPRRVAN